MNLEDSIKNLPGVGESSLKKLGILGIKTIHDLIFHIPNRYEDYSNTKKIYTLQIGETVTVVGTIASLINQYTKSGKYMQIVEIRDETGSIFAIWFNQKYLLSSLKKGTQIAISGKVEWWTKKRAIYSPFYELISSDLHKGKIIPIYPQTKGINSKWLRAKMDYVIKNIAKDKFLDLIPDEIISKMGLPNFYKAICDIHTPQTLDEAENGRKRLAFEELLFLQIEGLQKKIDWKRLDVANKFVIDNKKIEGFIKSLPYELTSSQKTASDEILQDLMLPYPMNRLLEGDVGSGKTAVAAIAIFSSFINGFSSVFMAPTQILAEQHFNTLNKLFEKQNIKIALLTGNQKPKSLAKYDVLVGTHAILHSKEKMKNLGLVIIDEQHRFGVGQRLHLLRESNVAPHVLTMTATPIPRTVALTLYGDLDLSVLTDMPKGRIQTKTWLVPNSKRKNAYKWIEKTMKKDKIQTFIVCPLIDESEVESLQSVKSAKKEFETIKALFPKMEVGLLHGKTKAKEKTQILEKFQNKEIDILVTTPVVEVGVDIPNANIMVIEASDRFGLASLHQLRGRIGRGQKNSFCLLFTESENEKTISKLKSMESHLSGFELSELDFKLRGAGDIFGTRQHGFGRLKVAKWSDGELIKESRHLAEEVLEKPGKFAKLHKHLKEKLSVAN